MTVPPVLSGLALCPVMALWLLLLFSFPLPTQLQQAAGSTEDLVVGILRKKPPSLGEETMY